MNVFKSLNSIEIDRPTAIALGTFDGVHLGHQAVINQMITSAEKANLAKTIVTFDAVPKQHGKAPSLLMSAEEKLAMFAKMDVDNVIILTFNQQLKTMSRDDFYLLLRENILARVIAVGEDFRFGYKAEGDVFYLEQQTLNDGIDLHIVEIVKNDEEKISSTAIREALISGNIAKANTMLGHAHFFKGIVKTGKKMGAKLGFATANLTVETYMTTVKAGVYITETKIGDTTYRSVSNVGYNPTFEQNEFNIETHILDFNKELYGEIISVSFLKRLRDEMRFESLDSLCKQIETDVEMARTYFNDF